VAAMNMERRVFVADRARPMEFSTSCTCAGWGRPRAGSASTGRRWRFPRRRPGRLVFFQVAVGDEGFARRVAPDRDRALEIDDVVGRARAFGETEHDVGSQKRAPDVRSGVMSTSRRAPGWRERMAFVKASRRHS